MNNVDTISLKKLIFRIREIFKYLKANLLVIIIAGIIAALLGVGYAYIKKPIYKAVLSFALENEKSGGGLSSALGLASQFGIDLGGGGDGAFSGDNLLQLMKSRLMVQNTLLVPTTLEGKKQTLAEFYISFNNLRDKWDDKPLLKNIHFKPGDNPDKFTLQQDSLLGEFYKTLINKNLVIDKVDKRLSIITITVNSQNEMFSKVFAEVLANTVSDFYRRIKTQKSTQNVNILQHQADSVKRELNMAINGVANSIEVNPNPNAALQTLRVPSQRRQVDVQINTTVLGELTKNLAISKISLRKETPLIQIIDTPILPLEKDKVSKIKAAIVMWFVGSFLAILALVLKKYLQNFEF